MTQVVFIIKLTALFIFFGWFPGYVALRLFRISLSRSILAFVFLPFLFGIPATSIVYLLTRLAHVEPLIPLFPLSLFGICLFIWRRDGFPQFKQTIERRHALIFLTLLAMVLVYFGSFASRTHYDKEGGLMMGDGAFSDNIWSISVLAEIHNHIPPRLPLLAGYRMRYHYVGDLFIDLLYRVSHCPATLLEFNFKYMPPYFILILFSVLYLSLSYCFKKPSIALLTLGLLALAPLRTPLFFKNHSTLAMSFFYTATFLLLTHYDRNKTEKGYLYAGFLLLGILPLYDAAFGLVINTSLLVYAAFDALRAKKWTPVLKAFLVGATFGGIIYVIALGWPAGHAGSLVLGKGPQMAVSRERFKWVTNLLKLGLDKMPGSGGFDGHILSKLIKGVYHTVFLIISFFIPPKDAPLRYHFLAIPALVAIFKNP